MGPMSQRPLGPVPLQWGHDEGVVEVTGPLDAFAVDAITASMGPRRRCRGSEPGFVGLSDDDRALQWGHDEGVVEVTQIGVDEQRC